LISPIFSSGNCWRISDSDIQQTVLISAVGWCVLMVFRRDLILFVLTPPDARSIASIPACSITCLPLVTVP